MSSSHLLLSPSSLFSYRNHCIPLIIFVAFLTALISSLRKNYWRHAECETWARECIRQYNDIFLIILSLHGQVCTCLFGYRWILIQWFQIFVHPCTNLQQSWYFYRVIAFSCIHTCIHLLCFYLINFCFVIFFCYLTATVDKHLYTWPTWVSLCNLQFY